MLFPLFRTAYDFIQGIAGSKAPGLHVLIFFFFFF